MDFKKEELNYIIAYLNTSYMTDEEILEALQGLSYAEYDLIAGLASVTGYNNVADRINNILLKVRIKISNKFLRTYYEGNANEFLDKIDIIYKGFLLDDLDLYTYDKINGLQDSDKEEQYNMIRASILKSYMEKNTKYYRKNLKKSK